MKPHVREGILPIILSALIEARAVTKRLLKDTEDPAKRAVLSSRQQALKTTANAAYGFTGQRPHLRPCKDGLGLLAAPPRSTLSWQRPGLAGATAVGEMTRGPVCRRPGQPPAVRAAGRLVPGAGRGVVQARQDAARRPLLLRPARPCLQGKSDARARTPA